MAGRFTSYWTTEVRYGVKGRALLTGTAASGQRSLSSCRWPRQRSTAASETSCFARPDESWPTCQWLPLWGSWRAQARLRGQGFGIPEGAKGPPFGDVAPGGGLSFWVSQWTHLLPHLPSLLYAILRKSQALHRKFTSALSGASRHLSQRERLWQSARRKKSPGEVATPWGISHCRR